MSGRTVNLTTLFLGRLRSPKRLISISCTYFRQSVTTSRVSNPGPLTYESGGLPTALRGPALFSESTGKGTYVLKISRGLVGYNRSYAVI